MKKILLGVTAIALLILISFFYFKTPQKENTPLPKNPLVPTESVETTPEPVISLEEKVGQLFMVGHWAHTPLASTTALIQNNHIGSVIIMSAPEDTEAIRSWTSAWREVMGSSSLIAIDQEGGPVSRLKGSAYTQVAQPEIDGAEEAFTVGETRGKELSKLGITLNFAPVLDTAQNPQSFMYARAFRDPKKSALFAAQMIAGMDSVGVTAVPKHFPGHDDTAEDSHVTLPSVLATKDTLDAFTTPFRELILNNEPKALMTAHALFPKIDTVPATLSHFFLTDYLRDSLHFSGVIITDDMSMDAIDTFYDTNTASIEAIKAGADIILFAAEPARVETAVAAVITAVQNGTLSEERINESYTRIEKLRQGIR